jgi:MFS family permease
MRLRSLLSRRVAIFAVFAAAYFLSQFFRSANAVLSKELAQDLALAAAQLGLMTSLFYVAFAMVQPPLGIALDRWGARAVTPTLMLVGAMGSLLFATGHAFAQVALGRALIGMGMAGVYMGSLKVFSRWFSLRRFATVSGFLVAFGSLGALSAAAPLARMAGVFGWRAVFLLGALAVVASALAVALVVRNAPPGAALREHGTEHGSIVQVFRNRTFIRIACADFFLVGTFLAAQGLWAGPFLYDVMGYTRNQAGTTLLFISLGALTGYPFSGWLAERFGMARVVVVGMTAFLLSQVGFLLAGRAGLGWLVCACFFVFGLGGSANILLLAHSRAVFPTAMTGRAVTGVNFFGMGGVAVLQWTMGVIIGSFAHDAAGRYPFAAFVAAFGITVVGGAAALLWYAPLAKEGRAAPLTVRFEPRMTGGADAGATAVREDA